MADYSFDHQGPFVGATAGWNIAHEIFDGTLAFTGAVGFFSGELDVSNHNFDIVLDNGAVVPTAFDTEDLFDTRGDTLGISLGPWLARFDPDRKADVLARREWLFV